MTATIGVLSSASRIGLDTSIFIHFVERHPVYVAAVRAIFQQITDGQYLAYSSVVTLTEVLTYPKRIQDQRLVDEYWQMLTTTRNFTLLDTTPAIADVAADLRARHGLRTPDAIQIASALATGCGAFLTNDARLRRVADLPILTLDDLAS